MSALRTTLRTVALALFFAFAIGFGVGTWLRCRMERTPAYIGAIPESLDLGLGAAFPLDVRHARASVLDARQHEEQVREPIQVAERAGGE